MAVALGLAACGGEPEAHAPILREGPADQILRVARVWEALAEESGFRTPPSPIATFTTKITSRVALGDDRKTARESLSFTSHFKLSDGREFVCQASGEVTCAVRFADHGGDAAVELVRPAVSVPRRCNPAGFPEPTVDLPVSTARFALRSDRLVPFAPASERREFIPAD